MRINHNISALNANNQLNRNDNKMSKSLERLTSGLKINSAADDAAGMAISQKMRTQIAGLDKASDNASDGISVIQTAEGALEEVESCLQRMRELSVQAANGISTTSDREAIQQEIDALNAEIQRISDTTEFNTKKLLDGTIDRKAFSNNTGVNIVSVSDSVLSDKYSLTVTQDARQAVIVSNPMGKGAAADKKITQDQAGTINVNGIDVKIAEGDSYDEVFEKIRNGSSISSIYAFTTSKLTYDMTDEKVVDYAGYSSETATFEASQRLLFVSKSSGSDEEIEVICDNQKLADLVGLSTNSIKTSGADAKVKLTTTAGFADTATVAADGKNVKITDNNGFSIKIEVQPGAAGTKFTDMTVADAVNKTTPAAPSTAAPVAIDITVLDAGPMSLHIGANAYQTMEVTIPKVDPETLGVSDVNVSTEAGAQQAITNVSAAVDRVSSIRAKLGAYQNRLEHAISNLDTANENMTESLSRIEDTDMAEEMAAYTQYNVLVQAGTSMLAQANQRPQNILSLLQ